MDDWKTINYNTTGLPPVSSDLGFNNSYSFNNNDPIHTMFLKKRKQELGEENVDLNRVEHNKSEIVELEEFCKKYGILAANFGNMPPAMALRLLKNKMGIFEEPVASKKDKHLLKG